MAFDNITPEMVGNCYAHVEEQEDWYRHLHQLEPPHVEEIDVIPVDLPLDAEVIQQAPEEGTIQFDEDIFSFLKIWESDKFTLHVSSLWRHLLAAPPSTSSWGDLMAHFQTNCFLFIVH